MDPVLKRLALAATLVCYFTQAAWGACLATQNVGNTAFGSATVAVTFGSNVTAHNLIVCGIGWSDQTGTVAMSGSVNGALTAIDNPFLNGDGTSSATFYKADIAAGAETITATFTGSTPNGKLVCHEVSGVAITNPLDQHKFVGLNSPAVGANTNTTTPDVTTTTDGQYIFGFTWPSNAGGGTMSAGTSPIAYNICNNTASNSASEDFVQTTAGAISVTFGVGATFGNFSTTIVTFKAPAAASTTPSRMLLGIGQ